MESSPVGQNNLASGVPWQGRQRPANGSNLRKRLRAKSRRKDPFFALEKSLSQRYSRPGVRKEAGIAKSPQVPVAHALLKEVLCLRIYGGHGPHSNSLLV